MVSHLKGQTVLFCARVVSDRATRLYLTSAGLVIIIGAGRRLSRRSCCRGSRRPRHTATNYASRTL